MSNFCESEEMKKFKLEISIGQYVCFAICLLLMLVIPIVHSQKIIGIDISKTSTEENTETISTDAEGNTVINTTSLGQDIVGYSGPTPVEITLNNDRISKIKVLKNRETPEFLGSVLNSDLLDSYKGLSLQEAASHKVDAVSGATFTSSAIIQNIHSGIEYALDNPVSETTRPQEQSLDFKWYATLLIVLAGAIIPLYLKNRKYRYIQLAFNVIVLGFWGGTFVSYSIMVSALTNGLGRLILVPTALMLVVAFIYPMFGKINHYCTWICPYGSLQDLASLCSKKKITLPPYLAKYLVVFRQVLWFALMWLLWTGLWFDWMGYEPFAAFFFRDASPIVLGIAGGFILLSVFIPRPYCRFVCPTGSLFKFSEGSK